MTALPLRQVSDITLSDRHHPYAERWGLSVGGESQTTIAVSAENGNRLRSTPPAPPSPAITSTVQQLNDLLQVYDRTRSIYSLMYQQPGVDSSQRRGHWRLR